MKREISKRSRRILNMSAWALVICIALIALVVGLLPHFPNNALLLAMLFNLIFVFLTSLFNICLYSLWYYIVKPVIARIKQRKMDAHGSNPSLAPHSKDFTEPDIPFFENPVDFKIFRHAVIASVIFSIVFAISSTQQSLENSGFFSEFASVVSALGLFASFFVLFYINCVVTIITPASFYYKYHRSQKNKNISVEPDEVSEVSSESPVVSSADDPETAPIPVSPIEEVDDPSSTDTIDAEAEIKPPLSCDQDKAESVSDEPATPISDIEVPPPVADQPTPLLLEEEPLTDTFLLDILLDEEEEDDDFTLPEPEPYHPPYCITQNEFSRFGGIDADLLTIDTMNGHDFEHWCAKMLTNMGYSHVEVTPDTGDQGVDIVAYKDSIKYAIQCKRYSSDLGNTPIQEVYAGKDFYDCDVSVVLTNQHFTKGAKALADKTRTRLWDREFIKAYLASDTHTMIPDYIYTPEYHFEPETSKQDYDDNEIDDLFDDAVDVVVEMGMASVSILQRRLKIAYSRAARLVDQMELLGIVGPFEGSTPRQVLISKEDAYRIMQHYRKVHHIDSVPDKPITIHDRYFISAIRIADSSGSVSCSILLAKLHLTDSHVSSLIQLMVSEHIVAPAEDSSNYVVIMSHEEIDDYIRKLPSRQSQ